MMFDDKCNRCGALAAGMKHRNDPMGRFCEVCVPRPPYDVLGVPMETKLTFVPDHRALRERITLAVLEKSTSPDNVVQISHAIVSWILDGEMSL